MPMYEFFCETCRATEEHFVRHWDDTIDCPVCLGPRVKLASRFASPFSGSIHKYTIPGRENDHIDGFWAYRKRSSISGQPEPVYLDSMQAVKEFNKAEGLSAPGEVPTNSTISSDGRNVESRGMKGQWVTGLPEFPTRLKEMIATPAEQCTTSATATPCLPITYGMRAEVAVPPPEVGEA